MEPKSMSKQLRARRTLIYIFFGILTLLSLIPSKLLQVFHFYQEVLWLIIYKY